MDSYFLPVDEEPIFFFSKEMADEFIGEAVEFCVEEVENNTHRIIKDLRLLPDYPFIEINH